MDTPKRQVSWLESFPPDIWAYLSWYLPGEQLERLLMTGATLLMHRLTSHHTVKSIKLGQDFMSFKSLTRLFNDFSYVNELYIHSLSYEWSDMIGMTIDSMPLGLRKLELRGNWETLADELFDKDGRTLKLNEHLPCLEVLDLPFTTFTWMAHSPQSLTKLSLRNWDGSVELPPSLIHFEADDVTLSTSSLVSKLPPSLETFNAEILIGAELLVPLLPTSTRKLCLHLSMRYSDGPRPSWNLLEQLPKLLTCLKVPSARREINFETNPELVSHLPSTLTELYIQFILPCSCWRLLPQQLTILSFKVDQSYSTVSSKTVYNHEVHHEVDTIPFEYFPRSITSLRMIGTEFFFCGPPTTCDVSYFPPQLTHLEIPYIQLSDETSKLLPSFLPFLETSNLCERVCEHLPNSIKTLSSSSTLLTPNLIKFLPKSLTSLQLNVSRSYHSWYDCNTGKSIHVENHLQYSIQDDCLSPSFDWKDHSPLPSTLTELYIRSADGLGDTFLQHQQLPNLTKLDLWESKHLTDLSIHHLPHHLTYLDLRSSSKVSGKSFKFLPRVLTHLNLSDSESIFDSDIEHLPRTLKHAYLNHAIHLSDICIFDLPPHLESLKMELNSQISTSCFPRLPYPMRSTQTYQSVEFATWKVTSGVLKVKNSTSAK